MYPNIRIAFAEDHPIVRSGIIALINGFADCNVVTDACNGEDLIKNIAEMDTKPDITILDISMPVRNGYDTITELKRTYPGMKFLVLTMLEKEYAIIKMIRSGANGYILKRCNPSELQQAIKDIYSYGFYFSNIASKHIFNLAKANGSPKLSDREIQFIKLCSTDMSYNDIATTMYISVRTVEGYKNTLYTKLNVNSRIGLVLFAVRAGIISLNE